MRRFRVKSSEPGLVRVETRVRPGERAALAERAGRSQVSVAEFLRTMLAIELDESNPYSAEAFLRLSAAQDKELRDRAARAA